MFLLFARRTRACERLRGIVIPIQYRCASEYIPPKIGLGIEIMCLRAARYRSDGRYRFNSITCFFFIIESALTAHMLLLAASFGPIFSSAARPYAHALPSDQVGPVAVKVFCFATWASRPCSHVLPMAADPSDRRGSMSYAAMYSSRKGRNFRKRWRVSSSDATWCDLVIWRQRAV